MSKKDKELEKAAYQAEQKLKSSEQSSSTFFEKLIGYIVVLSVIILVIVGLVAVF